MGAVIGREFGYELLAAISSMGEAELNSALNDGVRSELIYQRGTPPRATFLFKHALIQDTAYDSLLKRRRAELHERIARAIQHTSATLRRGSPKPSPTTTPRRGWQGRQFPTGRTLERTRWRARPTRKPWGI